MLAVNMNDVSLLPGVGGPEGGDGAVSTSGMWRWKL